MVMTCRAESISEPRATSWCPEGPNKSAGLAPVYEVPSPFLLEMTSDPEEMCKFFQATLPVSWVAAGVQTDRSPDCGALDISVTSSRSRNVVGTSITNWWLHKIGSCPCRFAFSFMM
jgi:hypothetical protein